MKEFTYPIYQFLYLHLTLQTAGIAVGVFLILTHAWALVKGEEAKSWLVKLPRSQSAGTILLTIGFLWAWVLGTSVDLGEFTKARAIATYGIPAAYVAMLLYANDYLGARALGILALLASSPILEAAFLQPPQSRLFLVSLVYVWILLALFWVGMPYTLRDQIARVTRSGSLWKVMVWAGLGYGVLLLTLALTSWGGLTRLVHI